MNYNEIRYQYTGTLSQYNDEVVKVYVCPPVAIWREFTKSMPPCSLMVIGRCLNSIIDKGLRHNIYVLCLKKKVKYVAKILLVIMNLFMLWYTSDRQTDKLDCSVTTPYTLI